MQVLRYAADIPFPEYAFVPAKHPHPVTDPRGHSFGQAHTTATPLDPAQPMASRAFLFAIDLFNAGFYWEAHEAWEGLWVAAGRTGTTADFLKGLIKLAAAGVKAREGQTQGVRRHARRAEELFRIVRATCPDDQTHYAGLSCEHLIQASSSLALEPIIDTTPTTMGSPVLPCRLEIELRGIGSVPQE